MHDSALRLLECARKATEQSVAAQRVQDFGALRRRMGVTPATMTNWKSRGVSKEGALQAEQLFKCSASWILEGPGAGWTFPQHASEGERTPPMAQELSHVGYTVAPRHVDWELLMRSPMNAEFQTTAPDASMAPDVPSGARIIFVTGVEPQAGDFVLVADALGNHYLREYKVLKPGHWQAHAINPAYLPLDSASDKLRVLAVFDGIRGRRSAR